MIELDWLTFIGLLLLSGFVGAICNDGYRLRRKRRAQDKLTATMPFPDPPPLTLTIPVEPEVPHYSIEKHLEVVHCIAELLKPIEERLQDEWRLAATLKKFGNPAAGQRTAKETAELLRLMAACRERANAWEQSPRKLEDKEK